MAQSSWPESIRHLLLSEGGFVNHPSDPGGPTNFGITIADYRRYKKPDATIADIRAMRVEDARAIYQAKYWDRMRAGELAAGPDYAAFDYAVNSGTGRAPRVLQRICGVAITGKMDDATMRAIARRNPAELVAALCDERLRFMQGLKTWPVFGKGWARRVAEVRAFGLKLAATAAAPAAVRVPPASDTAAAPPPVVVVPASHPEPAGPTAGKAIVPESKAAKETTKWGGSGGLGAIAIAARDWALAHPWEAGIAAAAVVAAIFGVLWLIERARTSRQETPMPVPVLAPASAA